MAICNDSLWPALTRIPLCVAVSVHAKDVAYQEMMSSVFLFIFSDSQFIY